MKNKTAFLRALFISGIIFGCLVMLTVGISICYENIREISYAEFCESIEIGENYIRFLDFVIKK